MKKYYPLFLIFSAGAGYALETASGKVNSLSYATESSGYEDALTLVGVDALSDCGVSGGLVKFRFKRDEDYGRGFSLAHAAYVSDKEVEVKVNTSDKNLQGQCYIKIITIK